MRNILSVAGKELRSFRQDSQGFALYGSFDPAGKSLAIHERNNLRVVDVDSGKERTLSDD